MEQYSLQEAQIHLPKLIADVRHGKTVFIRDENNRLVQLVPISAPATSRKAGSARGLIKMAAAFDAPLTDFDAYME